MIKKFRDNLNNNKGMSLVTVIVALGFALILVNTIMLASTITFKMKTVNAYSKDAFYSAEQVLDEINVGLQQMVSDALSKAYTDVMLNYSESEYTPGQKNELVKANFYKNIEEEIGVQVGKDWKYIVMPYGVTNSSPVISTDPSTREGLYFFLKGSTRWHDGANIDEAYGAFLRAKGNLQDGTHYLGEMKLTKDDGIVLKDLIVYYRDTNGFISELKTDIRIVYPDFKFSDNKAPEINDYCFITDTCYEQLNRGVTSGNALKTTISGNSFAYKVNTSGIIMDYAQTGRGTDLHIVADEFNVVNGGINTTDNTEMWVKDIVAKSSDVNLAGYTYVEDDLDLLGTGCDVKMTGYYIGYGNSLNSAQSSSAILVNGMNTNLDLQYVKKLSLAGRAFVATSASDDKANSASADSALKNKSSVKAAKKVFNGDTQTSATQAIYMGESLSAKSNQLMYLLPGDCIAVDVNNVSKFGTNPITKAQYDQIESLGLTEIALNKSVDKLGPMYTLADFLDTDGSGKAKVEKVFIRSKDPDKTYVYYYMKFKDDEAANLYFSLYYGNNNDSVDNYMMQYINAIKFPDEIKRMDDASYIMSLKVSLAGNVIAEDSDGRFVPGQIHMKAYDEDGNRTIQAAFDEDYVLYSNQFKAYSSKLTPAIEALEGQILRDGDNKAIFKNLVNEEIFKEVTGGHTKTYFKSKDKEKALFVYSASVDDVITLSADKDMNCNLIIANCGVNLSEGSSFTGTILAKGKIVVPNKNFEFKAAPKKVDACMALSTEDGVYGLTDIFMDSEDVKFRSTSDDDSSAILAADLVKYENWTKNVEVGE